MVPDEEYPNATIIDFPKLFGELNSMLGSGKRSNAVVPTASPKKLEAGEMVMIGLAPKVSGYAGVIGDTLPVSGEYSPAQKECIKHLKHALYR